MRIKNQLLLKGVRNKFFKVADTKEEEKQKIIKESLERLEMKRKEQFIGLTSDSRV